MRRRSIWGAVSSRAFLVNRMRPSEQSAFDAVAKTILRERARIIAYARSIVRDEHLAEDIFQTATTIILRKQDEAVQVENPVAWARQIVRYEAMNALRREARHELHISPEVLDKLDGTWNRVDRHVATDSGEALRHCLKRLTPNAQNLVRLRYGEGLKSGELAKVLGRKVNTVYVALSRIHDALSKCIEQQIVRQEARA